jgi:hypothetical protein
MSIFGPVAAAVSLPTLVDAAPVELDVVVVVVVAVDVLPSPELELDTASDPPDSPLVSLARGPQARKLRAAMATVRRIAVECTRDDARDKEVHPPRMSDRQKATPGL